MPYGNENDAMLLEPSRPAPQPELWRIDPITRCVTPDRTHGNPVLIVVEPNVNLSASITEVCDFLQITLHSTPNPRHIPDMLPDCHPLAIIHHSPTLTCTLYDLLMVAAAHDPNLPLMVILPEAEHAHHALKTTQKLWQIQNLTLTPTPPDIRTLIDFLFSAGRRINRTRYMPI